MSVTDAHATDPHADEAHHPTSREYVQVAVFLALVTALEVVMFYIEVGWLFVPSLIVMMIVKFAVVAAFFMHLRYDSAVYRRFLITGLVIAISVFVVVLATFNVFGNRQQGEPAAIPLHETA